MVRLPRNKKQTYWLNSRAQMWPAGLTLAMTLTLNFQGQIWNSLYLSQKWSDCHETKSKHINWTLGLKCDQRVWPWPWPWPWISKVKYTICYISAKNGPIATKRKANISIELWGSNVTSGFDLGHDIDLEFSRSNIQFAISQPKMVRLPRNEKQTYRLNSRPQMWPMVWIYQIVTGVTSVVGVPSTHLVNLRFVLYSHSIYLSLSLSLSLSLDLDLDLDLAFSHSLFFIPWFLPCKWYQNLLITQHVLLGDFSITMTGMIFHCFIGIAPNIPKTTAGTMLNSLDVIQNSQYAF